VSRSTGRKAKKEKTTSERVDWDAVFPSEDLEDQVACGPLGSNDAATAQPEHDERFDPEAIDDLQQAIMLLAGRHKWSKGLPSKEYLTGNDEFVARKALVRLLRSSDPLDHVIRRQLAALFDRETEVPPYASFDAAPMERRIEIRQRHPGGGKIQNLRKFEIGIALNRLRHEHPAKTRDDAINEIADRFSLSTRAVEDAEARLNEVLDSE
jgi:hypothetical protein